MSRTLPSDASTAIKRQNKDLIPFRSIVKQYRSVQRARCLRKAARLSKHNQGTAETAPSVGGYNGTGDKRGKLREVTQPS
jgi:hypothetical protein